MTHSSLHPEYLLRHCTVGEVTLSLPQVTVIERTFVPSIPYPALHVTVKLAWYIKLFEEIGSAFITTGGGQYFTEIRNNLSYFP